MIPHQRPRAALQPWCLVEIETLHAPVDLVRIQTIVLELAAVLEDRNLYPSLGLVFLLPLRHFVASMAWGALSLRLQLAQCTN